MVEDLISVIVPVYKVEAYLDDCVKSIVRQTYRNLEIILVDDGSPDNSGAMCDAWARRDERIRVIHKENAGPGAARNTGIEAARGIYLTFVDSDDMIRPAFMETLYRAMEQADLAVCGIESEEDQWPLLNAEVVPVEKLAKTPSRYAHPAYVNSCFNKMYRAQIIRAHALRMDTTMRRAEDLCFVAQYLLHCQNIRIVSEKLYWYRQNAGSITHTFYKGIAVDEIKGWHIQRKLFLPDAELNEEERGFYSVWRYGKIQAILRYILSCAPSFGQARTEIRELLEDPEIGAAYTDGEVCRRLGRKKVVYAYLAKRRMYSMLLVLFRMAGVG